MDANQFSPTNEDLSTCGATGTHEHATACRYLGNDAWDCGPTPGPWAIFDLANDETTYGASAGKPIITANDHNIEVCGVVCNPKDALIIAAAPVALDALDQLTADLIEQHAEAGEYDGHNGDADHEGEAPEVCSYCAHIATARAVLAAAGRNVDHLTAR